MIFGAYTPDDYNVLEQQILRALTQRSQPLDMLYSELLTGHNQFYKFAEAREQCSESGIWLRVRDEKVRVSNALRRLEQRGLIEICPWPDTPPRAWRITADGMDLLNAPLPTRRSCAQEAVAQ